MRVYRTELNVPHIFARSALDRYRTMGFIMAKDRYAQIDLGRRVGQGRIGELVGSFGEEIDRQTRNRGLAEVAKRLWDAMSETRKLNLTPLHPASTIISAQFKRVPTRLRKSLIFFVAWSA